MTQYTRYLTVLLAAVQAYGLAASLQNGGAVAAWGWVAFKLTALGVVLIALAAVLFRRRFLAGLRA